MAPKYKVSKRTVICGGHDTFLKAIKPVLSGKVKYIDREKPFDGAVIQNADVVWIQTNAMSHKQQYKIMNITRAKGIPVRYFTNASAVKCLEQIREEDK